MTHVGVSSRPRSLVANPSGHAEILIESLGADTALELADLYARQWPANQYWVRVLGVLKERQVRGQSSGSSETPAPDMSCIPARERSV